jgi:VWFA-related protein
MLATGRAAAVVAILLGAGSLRGAQDPDGTASPGAFQFSGGVELVNVTATVSDRDGRFVSGLTRDNFTVYEDDRLQTITHFSAERVPVSLGIVVDTSGSMAGEKIRAARRALGRFLTDLLDPEDELFLYQFSDEPVLLQDWTTDRLLLSRELGRIEAKGGTAIYDAATEAVVMA